MSEAHFGELSFFRVIPAPSFGMRTLQRGPQQSPSASGRFTCSTARPHRWTNCSTPGDIGAVVKLKDTHTGNTLCGRQEKPVRLPKVQYPAPTIHAALISSVKGEEDKLAAGLAALHEEDPTFLTASIPSCTRPSSRPRANCTWKSGRASARRFNVHVELGEPRIPFRETIKGPGRFPLPPQEADRRRGPVRRGLDEDRAASRATPASSSPNPSPARTWTASLSPPSRKASERLREGIVAGYRVVDVKIDFYDGKMHPVDSKDIAFQIAGYFAFKEAFLKARPCLLEPIHHGRGAHSRRLPGQGHGRHFQPARPHPGHGRRGHVPGVKALVPAANFTATPAPCAP
jgi:elongation factor G